MQTNQYPDAQRQCFKDGLSVSPPTHMKFSTKQVIKFHMPTTCLGTLSLEDLNLMTVYCFSHCLCLDSICLMKLKSCQRGWIVATKKKYSTFYNRREELSVTFDKLICLNDRILIPPTLRSTVLQDLHSSHLGVEKMKSLARLTCYWPELNEDIKAFVASCTTCKTNTRSRSSNWTPWPAAYKCFQHIHADYAGPFDEFYTLIVINAYSK